MLMKLCQELERCAAFTTDGMLKTRVGSMEAMLDVTSSGDGLYVAGRSCVYSHTVCCMVFN